MSQTNEIARIIRRGSWLKTITLIVTRQCNMKMHALRVWSRVWMIYSNLCTAMCFERVVIKRLWKPCAFERVTANLTFSTRIKNFCGELQMDGKDYKFIGKRRYGRHFTANGCFWTDIGTPREMACLASRPNAARTKMSCTIELSLKYRIFMKIWFPLMLLCDALRFQS